MLEQFKLRKSPPLIVFARLTLRRFREERCLQIASSLTFTALLAIVPIITVALTLISAFPVFRELMLHAAAREGLACPVYCLMPDHIHLVWMGLRRNSDQINGMAFLRTYLEPALHPARF